MEWLNHNFLNLLVGVVSMLPAGLAVGMIDSDCTSRRVPWIAGAVMFGVTAVLVGQFAGITGALATLVSGFAMVSVVKLQMWLYYRRRRQEDAVYQALGTLAGSIAALKRQSQSNS